MAKSKPPSFLLPGQGFSSKDFGFSGGGVNFGGGRHEISGTLTFEQEQFRQQQEAARLRRIAEDKRISQEKSVSIMDEPPKQQTAEPEGAVIFFTPEQLTEFTPTQRKVASGIGRPTGEKLGLVPLQQRTIKEQLKEEIKEDKKEVVKSESKSLLGETTSKTFIPPSVFGGSSVFGGTSQLFDAEKSVTQALRRQGIEPPRKLKMLETEQSRQREEFAGERFEVEKGVFSIFPDVIKDIQKEKIDVASSLFEESRGSELDKLKRSEALGELTPTGKQRLKELKETTPASEQIVNPSPFFFTKDQTSAIVAGALTAPESLVSFAGQAATDPLGTAIALPSGIFQTITDPRRQAFALGQAPLDLALTAGVSSVFKKLKVKINIPTKKPKISVTNVFTTGQEKLLGTVDDIDVSSATGKTVFKTDVVQPRIFKKPKITKFGGSADTAAIDITRKGEGVRVVRGKLKIGLLDQPPPRNAFDVASNIGFHSIGDDLIKGISDTDIFKSSKKGFGKGKRLAGSSGEFISQRLDDKIFGNEKIVKSRIAGTSLDDVIDGKSKSGGIQLGEAFIEKIDDIDAPKQIDFTKRGGQLIVTEDGITTVSSASNVPQKPFGVIIDQVPEVVSKSKNIISPEGVIITQAATELLETKFTPKPKPLIKPTGIFGSLQLKGLVDTTTKTQTKTIPKSTSFPESNFGLFPTSKKNPFDNIFAIRTKTIQKTGQQSKQRTDQQSRIDQIFDTSPLNKIKPKLQEKQKSDTELIQQPSLQPLLEIDTQLKQKQRLDQQLKQKQDLQLKQKQIQKGGTIPFSTTFGLGGTALPLFLPPVSDTVDSDLGFNVFVKRKQRKRGKGKFSSRGFKRANKRPLSRNAALGLGAKHVDEFTNRSFTIRSAKGKGKRDINLENIWGAKRNKFRPQIRKGKVNRNILIEKSLFAIDSKSEVAGIPFESARLRKAGKFKKKKKKSSLFGETLRGVF